VLPARRASSRQESRSTGHGARADWIIDLGPGAGHDGGRIVFEGTPADLVTTRSTLTGEHLAAYVGT
jgi:excinuclease UvrABC ATPase subunit